MAPLLSRGLGVTRNQKPGTPTVGTVTATGATTVTVAYTAPANNGGSPIKSYTAVSSPGNITGTLNQAGSGTITVSGLTSGTAYTFTVYASNSVGAGRSSSASASVTPQTPAPPSVSFFMYGGGGNGGFYGGGGGGGSGYSTGTQSITVGTTYNISVAGATGTTSFGSYSAVGGCSGAGYPCSPRSGGNSGTGYSGSGNGGGGGAGGPGGVCVNGFYNGGGDGGYYSGLFGLSCGNSVVTWGGGGGGGLGNTYYPGGYGPFPNGGSPGGGGGGQLADGGNAYGINANGGCGAYGGGGGGGGVCYYCFYGSGGGAGGAGYVWIWYHNASYRLPTTVTGSYSTSVNSNGYRVYAFSGSGSIKW